MQKEMSADRCRPLAHLGCFYSIMDHTIYCDFHFGRFIVFDRLPSPVLEASFSTTYSRTRMGRTFTATGWDAKQMHYQACSGHLPGRLFVAERQTRLFACAYFYVIRY